MRIIFMTVLVLCSLTGISQVSYSGFIGKYPIQLVTYIYSDGDARAIYAYDKFDTPIIINGRKEGKNLKLFERDSNDHISASLKFENYDGKNADLTGIWISRDSTKKYPIRLKKVFDAESDADFHDKEILQSTSLDRYYFKLLISKTNGNARVTGVKVLEKKTDRLIQKMRLDCQLWGLENISTGDYNFDGLMDFSVFEESYAGPNTTSIYILRLPNSEKYFVSDFSGVSLEFDSNSKRIYEHNECCAGRSFMDATYKVVDNKMVLIERTCSEYDDEKEDFVNVKCD